MCDGVREGGAGGGAELAGRMDRSQHCCWCLRVIQKIVIKTVDVSYGGEAGFNQAIELAAETLGSVKLVQEKKLLQVREGRGG